MNTSREWFLNYGLLKHDARTIRNISDPDFVAHAKLASTEAEAAYIDFCVAAQQGA